MIRHVVCFRLMDPAQAPLWQEQSGILSQIETVKNFGAHLLLRRDRYDCALYMDFEDEAALAFYQQHPLHRRYLDEILPPLVRDKFVVDLLC